MKLSSIVDLALARGATDIHIESGQPVFFRVQGALVRAEVVGIVEFTDTYFPEILNENALQTLETCGTAAVSLMISGINCRFNVLKTDQGYGMAVRLLRSEACTLENSNLHPDLAKFLGKTSGLILVSGPKCSGKTTTLAAFIEEINQTSARHIITIENPIEYRFQSKKSLIRQREIGEHTSSFEQGLRDSLREDPNVIMVGELWNSETIDCTLNAAETGHLVLATVQASGAAEVLQRMMMDIPKEQQPALLSRLSENLIAIVSHKMSFQKEKRVMVPTLEILPATLAVRNAIRYGEFTKLSSLLQASANEGAWTFERYQTWIESKKSWIMPPLGSMTPVAPRELKMQRTSATRPKAQTRAETKRRERAAVAEPTHALENLDFSASASHAPRRTLSNEPAKHVSHAAELAREIEKSFGAKPAVVSTVKATRIHKDGRIEIPDLDVDLDQLAKSIDVRTDEF